MKLTAAVLRHIRSMHTMTNGELKEDDSQIELSPQSELDNSQQGRRNDSTKYIVTKKSGETLIYLCKLCDYKSTRKHGTSRHVRAVHLQEKAFGCDQCGRKYSDKRHLAAHISKCEISSKSV
jgi:uncharacterized Zn-finger protein